VPFVVETNCIDIRSLIAVRLLLPKENMAKLTTRARKKVPAKEFGEPGKRAYPMPDKAHAANAKARATQMVKKGKLSESEKKKIDAKANKKLGHTAK
jgi:hypothetical protein